MGVVAESVHGVGGVPWVVGNLCADGAPCWGVAGWKFDAGSAPCEVAAGNLGALGVAGSPQN